MNLIPKKELLKTDKDDDDDSYFAFLSNGDGENEKENEEKSHSSCECITNQHDVSSIYKVKMQLKRHCRLIILIVTFTLVFVAVVYVGKCVVHSELKKDT